jgi:hypothetical protein
LEVAEGAGSSPEARNLEAACLCVVVMALAFHSWASIKSHIGLQLSNFGFQRYDLKVVGRGSNEACLVQGSIVARCMWLSNFLMAASVSAKVSI